jgi:PAS domain S-box-containing protein
MNRANAYPVIGRGFAVQLQVSPRTGWPDARFGKRLAQFSTRMRRILLFCLLLSFAIRAESAHSPKGDLPVVLLLYADDRPLPSSQEFDAGLRKTMGVGDAYSLHTEFLGLNTFSSESEQRRMAEFLRQRYEVHPPVAIVAAGAQALDFVRKFRGTALPDVPVLFSSVRSSVYQPADQHAEYGVTMAWDMRPTADLMLRLHPDLKEIVVVTGSSFIDERIHATAVAELAPLADRVKLTYWNGLTLPELLARTRRLEAGAAIYFCTFMMDARGVNYTSNLVVRQVTNVARVPVYGFSATYVGRGVVGAQSELFGEYGEVVGRLLVQVLSGQPPSKSGAVEGPSAVLQLDAQQLDRWDIDPSLIPPGARVVPEGTETASELQLRFLFALTALLLLVALVIILLVNRHRLRTTERELSERLRFEQLASGVSAALINTPPERMDAEVGLALEKLRVAARFDRCVLFNFEATSAVKRITHRAEAPGCRQLPDTMSSDQLPWFFRQLEGGRVVALSDTARDLPADAVAERMFCAEQDLRSVLIMPVRRGSLVVSWIGFYLTQRAQVWSAELKARLHMVADILVSALAGAAAEEALRESEQMNRDILSSLHDQVALLDRHGRILSVNQAWYRFLSETGGQDEAVLGSNYLEVCRNSVARGHRDAARVLAGVEGVLQGNRRHFDMVYSSEYPGTPHVRWFRIAVTPFNTPSGGAVVMHTDVTEQQRLHEALLQSEERYREVVESQTELVCRYRGDTILTFVNEAYCRFFGRTRESLLGRSFLDLIPAAARPQVLEQIATLRRERRSHTYEHEVIQAGGAVGWQQWIDYPILDERGEIEEFQAIGRDITDRKRAEEANRNLAHAARLAIAGELTASIAHEINQPLGAILSNADAAEMLLERASPPLDEIRQILADIKRDDERAGNVIRHLRSLLRKHELEIRPIEVNELIGEGLRLAAADGQRRRIRFARDFATDLPLVLGDRVHLQQVLLNLLLNAMDAMAETPVDQRRLSVRTRRLANNRVEIAIADTGHGIPPERLGHIFDSFFTTKRDGMGLGLSIARSLIDAHRGTITAQNNPDVGATFLIVLPGSPA